MVRKNADKINSVANERVGAEMNLIFNHKDTAILLQKMYKNGLLIALFPALKKTEHYWHRKFGTRKLINHLFSVCTNIDSVLNTVTIRNMKIYARNFGISERDLEDKDSRPYFIIDQAEILEQTDMMAKSLSSFLTAVALISLLVGSIGIMNIMLVSVTERTREIGILMSLGFTGFDILFLFMVESILLGVFGGIIGGAVGIAGAYSVETLLNLPVVFPFSLIIAGFLVAVVVGFVSGVYPARKAAKMKPVDSLRYE